MPQDNRVSAAICAYNPPDVWKEVLARLQEGPFEAILVIDDGSPLPLEYDSDDSRVQICRLEMNRGLSHARNVAISQVDTPWILFVDSDLVPSKVLMESLSNTLAESQSAGIGFTTVEYHRYRIWDSLRSFENSRNLRRAKNGPAEWLSGKLTAYRTEALKAVEGFDERLRTNGEDVDMGYRLTRASHPLERRAGVWGTHYRKDTFWGFLKLNYRYSLTSKLVDRSLYFEEERRAHTKVPLVRTSSVLAFLKLYGSFIASRPYYFFVPFLAAAAVFLGALKGRQITARSR